jgi:hypothetical protein
MTTQPEKQLDPCGDYSLACRACAEKFAKWQRLIEDISHDVGWLVNDHEIFRTVTDLMGAAQLPGLDGTFYTWLDHTYQETVSVRIRRLVDRDKSTVSLRVLLDDIAANSKVLSRARFVSLYPDHIDWVAQDMFDRLTGKGEQFLPAVVAKTDLDELIIASPRIKDVVDKMFGHHDRKPPDEAPTWGEIKACIERLKKTTQKYRALLLGDSLTRKVERELPEGWTHVFRQPWIR